MKNIIIKIFAGGILLSFLFSSLSAQTFMLQNEAKDKSQFGVRYLRPYFDDSEGLSTFSGVYDFSFNIPVSSKINLVGSLPYTTISIDDEDSESGIGNVYLGIQTRSELSDGKSNSLSVGVFLPTAPDDKWSCSYLGWFSNYHDIQKYAPDVMTLYFNYAGYKTNPNGVRLGFELGPNFFIPTGDDNNDKTELFLHYGFSCGLQLNKFALSTELTGLVFLSEDFEELSDRFVHSLVMGGQWTGSTVRPGLFYKIYLKKDLNDFIDGILGLKLDVSLN